MKKAILGFVVPTFAIASLVGAGYATWYFNEATDGETTITQDISVEVTDPTRLGQFNKEGSIKLVLDEPADRNHGGLGVHFKEDTTFSVKYTYDPSITGDVKKPVVTWTITTNPSLTNLTKYVDIQINNSKGTLADNGTGTAEFTLDTLKSAVSLNYTTAVTDETTGVNTYSAYESMVSEIGTITDVLTISFTAAFSEEAGA